MFTVLCTLNKFLPTFPYSQARSQGGGQGGKTPWTCESRLSRIQARYRPAYSYLKCCSFAKTMDSLFGLVKTSKSGLGFLLILPKNSKTCTSQCQQKIAVKNDKHNSLICNLTKQIYGYTTKYNKNTTKTVTWNQVIKEKMIK